MLVIIRSRDSSPINLVNERRISSTVLKILWRNQFIFAGSVLLSSLLYSDLVFSATKYSAGPIIRNLKRLLWTNKDSRFRYFFLMFHYRKPKMSRFKYNSRFISRNVLHQIQSGIPVVFSLKEPIGYIQQQQFCIVIWVMLFKTAFTCKPYYYTIIS